MSGTSTSTSVCLLISSTSSGVGSRSSGGSYNLSKVVLFDTMFNAWAVTSVEERN